MINKTGMFVYAMAFLLGIIFVQQQSVLPEPVLLISALLFFSFLLFLSTRVLKYLFLFREITLTIAIIILITIGILYSSYGSELQLSHRLDDNLVGQNIIVNGTISSIPVKGDRAQRFEFSVNKYRILGEEILPVSKSHFPKKIRLSWYYGKPVNAGDNWQLEVRLKPPHGFMNPGGFDYEAWLFQNKIDATGYVRKSAFNLSEAEKFKPPLSARVNQIRQALGGDIDAGGSDAYALVKALAIGDKSSISNNQWRVLTNTGTSHLMAISGLHIGLAALFAYSLIRRLVPVGVMQRVPAQHIALSGGLVVAALYALIAGLSIPTQRAIIMLFVLVIMTLVRKNHRPMDALGLAMVLVLLFDPLAVLSVGFWFSFSAVAVIFISLNPGDVEAGQNQQSIKSKAVTILKQWVRLQLLISLFLLPLSLFMFQQSSLISPLANLILIPYVSFLVVPVVLLAIVCSFIQQSLADFLFSLAATLLEFIWPFLTYLSELPQALLIKGDVNIFELLFATAAMLLIYFSRKMSGTTFFFKKKYKQNIIVWALRIVACFMFIPMMVVEQSNLNKGEFQLTVLDVGQGSANVIRTQNHTLVFDAGAKFSDRFDVGSSVVIPYLRSQGITRLDRLLISHGDADHIGGAQAILDVFPNVLVVGQDVESLSTKNKQLCQKNMAWQWDDVNFIFLSPDMADSSFKSAKRNNRSCVLQVISRYGSVLLTGDIEKRSERALVDNYANNLASDILVVPHHGSNTSSSIDFIRAVNPKISLISAGYKNRYKLPSNKVTARYASEGRNFLTTSKEGAITVLISKANTLIFERYRENKSRYWHHNELQQRVAINR